MPPDNKLEQVSCLLGHVSTPVNVLTSRDMLHGLPGEFTIVKCPDCGLMWTNPRPTPEAMGTYYPDDYAPYSADARLGEGRFNWLRGALGLRNGNRTPAMPPGRLLEIGCSSGRYLKDMRDKGWSVAGLEFSPHAAEKARLKGLDVQVGSADVLARQFDDSYDLIAAWMVLEHLHDPLQVLHQLRQRISSRGVLAFSVPDAGSLELRVFGPYWYALHLPNHLFHFTPGTLRDLLQASGWEIEKVFWHSNPKNFLMSLSYLLQKQGRANLAAFLKQMAAGEKWPKVRTMLGVLLGLCRQSGRITVWARPK